MLEAFLRGKLSRSQENMEDLVTSMLFGILRHLDPVHFAAFVRQATLPDGTAPLTSLPTVTDATWAFWPWMAEQGCHGCEPDVLVDLTLTDGRRVTVLVEVKYLSGKSSFDDRLRPIDAAEKIPARDQLAREWENLGVRSGKHMADAWVLFVTPDIVLPAADIYAAQRELREKNKPPGNIAWVSLRSLWSVVQLDRSPWLADIRSALKRLDLLPFEGILRPEHGELRWSFEENWNWSGTVVGMPWRFA
jgi:hypothetical protein